MSLIQPSDFWGKLTIASSSEQGTQEKVQQYINEYTPKYLKLVFGDTLGDLLVNAMAVNEVVLNVDGDSTTITYTQEYRSNFGNRPRIIVDEIMDNGNKKRRNDVQPVYTVLNGFTTAIYIDFGDEGKYRITMGKQTSHEASISFMSGAANPLVISNWQSLYAADFGNNPRADVYQVEGDDRILRNDAGIELIGDPLNSIEIDKGDSPQIEVILYGNPPVIEDRLYNLLSNATLKQGLLRYVWYYYQRDNISFGTPMGEKRGTSAATSDASINGKLVDRWNEMVAYNWDLNKSVDRTVYPEYPNQASYNGWFGAWNCRLAEVYEPINRLGI